MTLQKNARDFQKKKKNIKIKKRKRTKELVVLSHFFCRSIIVDIFMEFLAFDELNEIA